MKTQNKTLKVIKKSGQSISTFPRKVPPKPKANINKTGK